MPDALRLSDLRLNHHCEVFGRPDKRSASGVRIHRPLPPHHFLNNHRITVSTMLMRTMVVTGK